MNDLFTPTPAELIARLDEIWPEGNMDTIEINKDDLLCVLWGICLSDHLGDVMGSIDRLTKPLGIGGCYSQESLLEKMRRMDLIPDYQRE